VEATDYLGALASSMGVLMALAPLLQMKRVFARRHSDDVSEPMLLVIGVGATAWLAYGVALGDYFLVVPNAIAVITNLATLAVVRRFHSRRALADRG
jgi:MtN3 and saliva related transmembrane protein